MDQERWLNKQRLVGEKLSEAGQGVWAWSAPMPEACRLPGVQCPGYQAGGITVKIIQVSPRGMDTGTWALSLREGGASVPLD